jgi:UrcA family protein
MTRLTTLFLTFVLTLTQQLASAAAPDVPSISVRYADLDLTRTAGAAALYGRLAVAAKTVCGPFEPRDLGSVARFNGCVERAIATAVAKVDQPALTHYALAHSKSRSATTQIAQR